jgi:hypothetical protein
MNRTRLLAGAESTPEPGWPDLKMLYLLCYSIASFLEKVCKQKT